MPAGAVPFPFGDCRVCLDKATGVHYGVATCEGCKGFFKRSLLKADRYKCFNHGQCKLSPEERNRCKLCRFQRCLQVGMSVTGVKMGRIPKAEKEKALTEMHREQLQRDKNHDSSSSRVVLSQMLNPLSPDYEGDHSNELQSQSQMEIEESELNSIDCREINSKGRNLALTANSGNHDYGRNRFENRYTNEARNVTVAKSRRKISRSMSNEYGSEAAFESTKLDLQNLSSNITRTEFVSNQFNVNVPSILPSEAPSGYEAAMAAIARESSSFGNGLSQNYNAQLCKPKCENLINSGSNSKLLPFHPTIIKEMLSQVIETGNTRELQQNLVKQFLSSVNGSRNDEAGFAQNRFSFVSMLSGNALHTNHSTAEVNQPESHKDVSAVTSNISEQRLSLPFEESSAKIKQWAEGLRDEDRELVGAHQAQIRPSSSNQSDEDSCWNTTREIREICRSESSSCTNTTNSSDDVKEDRERRSGSSESDKSSSLAICCALNCTGLSERSSCVSELKPKNIPYIRPTDVIALHDIEKMVKAVPVLTFWDIPFENNACQISEAEAIQRKKDIAMVLEWVGKIGYRFTEKVRKDFAILEEERNGTRPIQPLNLITEVAQEDIFRFWNEIVNCIPLCNFVIIGLCSAIPGFKELDWNDRAILMEAAYFEVWMILLSGLFQNGECYLRLLCEAQYTRFWMKLFMPDKLVNGMFKFAEELNSCELSYAEIVILCGIQLTEIIQSHVYFINPGWRQEEHPATKTCFNISMDRHIPDGRKTLNNPARVQRLHDYYLDLLAYELQRTHSANHSHVLMKLYQLLSMLAPIGREQLEITSNFRVDQPPEESIIAGWLSKTAPNSASR